MDDICAVCVLFAFEQTRMIVRSQWGQRVTDLPADVITH